MKRAFPAVFCAGFLICALWPSASIAQEEGAPEEEQTRQVSGISEKTYRKFAEAQELQEKDDYQGALRILNEVRDKKKLSSAEATQLYRFYGVLYFNMDRYRDAIKAFETLLEQDGIEDRDRTETLYTLAQLNFQLEDWDAAIRILNDWLKVVTNPPPEPLILLGTAYYQKSQYQQMVAPIERAISIARERDKPIKEQWWLLLRVAYYELGNIKKVVQILETLVVNWPKKEYWTMLSGMYGELNNENRQLSAYEAAYDQNLLVKSTEIVTLSQLLMQSEVGYKAAQILEKGLKDGIVDNTAANQRLLSQAWQMAAEFEKAIDPLKTAAAATNDGELDVRLANSYLQLGRHGECVSAARSGVNKGVKRPAVGYELLGMCLYEQEKYEDAKSAFRNAARDDKIADRARNWVKYIESEQLRISKLNESIAAARAARDAVAVEN